MEKIQLKLCAGTMCYVMGGAQLMEVIDLLDEDEKECVEISLSPCLGRCNGVDKPPFVELNGEIIKGVNKAALLQIIKDKLKDAVR